MAIIALAGIFVIPRLLLFISAMFIHRRWSVEISDLEKVLRAIHGGSHEAFPQSSADNTQNPEVGGAVES
ncbi:hypothetical protein [Streptomyces rochei]|uniref:hypothetical protein n=1 Tax=Streptomyces rochei TaxID=1928 RepID=UPI0013B823F4|nr:hypothetical protein [Streptomyces rochei]NEC77149.1 hypothetical protein [Streptomyces rochei]